ncbi:zf-TFIIB domain-containing protein, partial [bacterium]|nr:zf-TFIIB domain-containing protein [bacterium]
VPLHTFSYPQTYVRIDMCRRCSGLWLDGGEYKEIAAVRGRLDAKGKLDEYAPPVGLKGSILRLIDAAIETLRS